MFYYNLPLYVSLFPLSSCKVPKGKEMYSCITEVLSGEILSERLYLLLLQVYLQKYH